MLSSLEEGKDFANRYYLPLREAVVDFCGQRGQGRDAIVRTMGRRALALGGSRAQRIARDNIAAFEVFETMFYPRISKFYRSLLRDHQQGVGFEGIVLTGTPHLVVRDQNDRKRYVFLHPANWKGDELKAYLELLSIIVEQRFQAGAESIWCMNLRSGGDIRWRSSSRTRQRCAKAARLYARLVRAMGET